MTDYTAQVHSGGKEHRNNMGKRNVIRKAVKARAKSAPQYVTQEQSRALGEAYGEVSDPRPRVHVVGLHHTVPDETFSHCAFTGKVLRFPDVLRLAGYHTTEYSNGVSHSTADEHVQIFTRPQLQDFFGGEGELLAKCTIGNNQDTDVEQAFLLLVKRELAKRAQPGDVIAHVYAPRPELLRAFPDCVHVETGIGYASPPVGCYRIFESETWRAWHMGRHTLTQGGGGGTWPNYPELACTAVVPNYYDAAQWPVGDGSGGHVFFAGRMTSSKGIEVVNMLAEQFPDLTFAVASGEPRSDRLSAPNILWLGRIEQRAAMAGWMGGAIAVLVPSRFHEPFGGVAVEALLTGTPVIASDWAAFVETVKHGQGPALDDGIRCNDNTEFVMALHRVLDNPEWNEPALRKARAERAAERFGLEAVAARYKAALEMFRRQYAQGLRP